MPLIQSQIRLMMSCLAQHLPMNKARLNFLANFVRALCVVRSVNFVELAQAFVGDAKNESCYKRIQRFIKEFVIDPVALAKFCAHVANIQDQFVISIDRTNWKYGKTNINILTIGIVYKNVAVPVLWLMLPKQGNSNTSERIQLIEQFLTIFTVDQIEFITGDREFIGKEWFTYLISKSIHYNIRIKCNEKAFTKRMKSVPVKNLFRSSRPFEPKILGGQRKLWGVDVYIVGMKIVNDYVIVATDSKPEIALEQYKKRWSIETMFGFLKSKGFNFEATHLNKIERVGKLLALMSIAFVWACVTGEWHNREINPIKTKKHGRLEKSIFRTGLDILRTIFLGTKTNYFQIQHVIKLLSCT